MTKAILQLGALTCPSCMQKIQGALEKQAGVEKVKVLFNASKVKIEFDDTANTADALAQVVKNLSYEVQSVKVKQPAK
ncbi:heavy-metal-associated domain-containing protein [Pediococcus ethanolidurans]|uniref:heavy-metal-associated domain-containing protein n=1 Tax=Pediococcus ethanolidurans TaxID=319653 RepID=UPI001C1F0621|nr:heavy metal-associated domain-containing protein [Pediococcus ethanolidurans]MBU7555797.1 heavy-metal-associated domain-containing protein [Pediococcus ethanolidurans]MBU7563636.1 heavy-metal-associated domain-containing protein [Pediococcus ethanolidurans]MCT4397883.1 heavy-metal-associated domain-containing protein [Pediococcus ethanolidurans]MCV3315825.1 heavy-metal-associated domain-containing protein [Pediococcus ethanolidurans]MCV3322012.1 heavy-metal-associated domain-containing prot